MQTICGTGHTILGQSCCTMIGNQQHFFSKF